jgi:hypothetical protein
MAANRTVVLTTTPLFQRQVTGRAESITVTPGRHSWITPIGGPSFDGLLVSTSDHSPLPCLLSAQVVQASLVDAPGECRLVGDDGSPGPIVPCRTSLPASARTAGSTPLREKFSGGGAAPGLRR